MKQTIANVAAGVLATLLPVLVATSAQAEFALEEFASAEVVEREIVGLRPEMLDWWWDNINTTDRYQQWNPAEHVAFEWLTPPENPQHLDYSVGAIQQVTDHVAGQEVQVRITWMAPSLAKDYVTHDHWLLAKIEFAGYEQMSAPGWLLHEYSTNAAGNGVLLRTSFLLPDAVDSIYPGYAAAFAAHVTDDMHNLADFLPALFQQEFIEGELLTRGSYQVFHSGFLAKTVIVDQEIQGLTPAMVDWWWDNIDTTHRYRQWHPTAHISFKWINAPASPDQLQYSVGSVQQVSEYIGRYKSNLVITWLDPFQAKDKVTYEHWLYAKTELKGLRGIFPQRLIHEYRLNDTGDGILMRSTFTIPSFFDFFLPGFSRELAHHAQQEMQFLQYFLPELFRKEYLQETVH